MKRKMTRFFAAVLAGIMMVSGLPLLNAKAADQSNVAEKVVGAESLSELNYIYINKSYLEEQETQDIMVSWGDGTQKITHMVLKLSNGFGEIISLEGTNYEAETVLFSSTFDKGIYQIIGLEVTTDTTKEVTMEEYGISSFFGVGEEYSGEKSEYIEMASVDASVDEEIEFAVVSLDENNMDENAEEIAETLATVDTSAVATISLDDEFEVATTNDDGNLIVVLDPGHDSQHTGANGNGVSEEVVTLKIAKYCQEELEKYVGVTVYLTRTEATCPFPETVGPNNGNILDIKKRVEWAKSKGADVFVSIHLNSFDNSTVHGAEVYYPSQSTEGKNLAQKIQNELVDLGLYDRGIKSNDTYAVITSSAEAGFPGIIIEHAFVSNSLDATNFLKTDDDLKKLGIADATGIAKYYGLEKDQSTENYVGWIQTDDGWMWKSDGEYYRNRWLNIENTWYWFDENGYRITGWAYIGNYYYYFDSEGRMQTGWQTIGGKVYYLHNSGRMLTGWQTIDGKTYYFASSGAMVTGTVTIDGKQYQFAENGVCQGEVKTKGWNLIDGVWYYVKSDGRLATGWAYIGNYYYYFDSEGRMQTGWQTIGGKVYYLHNSGRMLTGWQTIDGKTYYFASSGAMVTGTVTIDGKQYQFAENGVCQGEVKTKGWNLIDGVWYYVKSDGRLATGWAYIGNYYYYFDSEGRMLTGWQYIGGYYYYFHSAGRMLTGWQTIDGKVYYFHSAGRMLTGWQTIDGNTYYFASSGEMTTGIVTIDGKQYQFDENGVCQGEVMAKGWNQIDGVWYYVKADGSLATSWEYIGDYYYYFDSEGRMQTGWQTIEGEVYYFHSAGRMLTGWQEIDNNTFYFKETGEMATGWLEISGVWNYFDSDGVFKQSGVTEICGKAEKTREQMIAFYNASGYTYPSETLKVGGAETLEQFVDLYIEEAAIEGIRADVAFAQAMIETKYLQYGGDVQVEQFNFAGLGATGGGEPGNSFADVQTGVRAHIQHLKGYATTEALVQECVDTRYGYVAKGSAPYVEWLGIQENPDGKGWASLKNYGFTIIAMLNKM